MARNSSRDFRRVKWLIIARDGGTCAICLHGGAETIDHVIPVRDWPRAPDGTLLPGVDHESNLQPAHGTRGKAEHNPCHECDPVRWPRGRLCNQTRGANGPRSEPDGDGHSRTW
jgi:5-methylcytosine-specific restriction endonuclease McrA